jgi:hypothetical protein
LGSLTGRVDWWWCPFFWHPLWCGLSYVVLQTGRQQLILPQCGLFYCHRDRRVGDADVPETLRAYNMSMLRLQREETNHGLPLYISGSNSFVRRFYSESQAEPKLYGPHHLLLPQWQLPCACLANLHGI